jgi:hypothetical protein
MAAFAPDYCKWRSPSSRDYLSSSEEEEEEEFGECDDWYDKDEYCEEEERDEDGYDDEKCDEEEGEYDEEECSEEEEEEYDDEYDEEGEYEEVECNEGEEEEYDDECDEEGEYDEEDSCEEKEWEGEEYDEDEYLDEEEEESDVVDCHKPSTWKDMACDKEMELVELTKNSPEYLKVQNKVQSTLRVHIDRVVRVQNPHLWGCYMLMKAEYESRLGAACKEVELFHATAESNILSIARNNLDWRRTKRAKFGNGVSFSPRACYANKYCNSDAGTKRALILARVLVGNCQKGWYGAKSPAEGYDTTTGNSKSVYVKYRDNEFYPEYVAYYTQ